MKTLKSITNCMTVALLLCGAVFFTSCDPAFWQGMAAGMSNLSNGGQYYSTPAASSYSSSSYSSSSSSSSTTTTKRRCPRCNGTGNCQTCSGTGKVYDYGPASAISKEKYTHNCRVCRGSGKCGVCDGKGYN